MATIAILGYGTVGSGVLEVLRRNAASIERRAGQPVTVKYICDIRDFSSHPDAALFVNNIDVILSDPEVTAVVETIGGLKPAYFYVKSALESGRHVVTSNKELVATHGAELLAIARRRGVCFLFEASVGGGTPIITPMHQCMAANDHQRDRGHRQRHHELHAHENGGGKIWISSAALKLEARALGYAETQRPFRGRGRHRRPAQRSAILASPCLRAACSPREQCPPGASGPSSLKDVALAAQLGCAVQADAPGRGEGTTARGALRPVEPMLVPAGKPARGRGGRVQRRAACGATCWATRCFTARARASCPRPAPWWRTLSTRCASGVPMHDSAVLAGPRPIAGG